MSAISFLCDVPLNNLATVFWSFSSRLQKQSYYGALCSNPVCFFSMSVWKCLKKIGKEKKQRRCQNYSYFLFLVSTASYCFSLKPQDEVPDMSLNRMCFPLQKKGVGEFWRLPPLATASPLRTICSIGPLRLSEQGFGAGRVVCSRSEGNHASSAPMDFWISAYIFNMSLQMLLILSPVARNDCLPNSRAGKSYFASLLPQITKMCICREAG